MIPATLAWLDDTGAVPLAELAARLPLADRDELATLGPLSRARSFALSRLLLRRTLGACLGLPTHTLRFRRTPEGRLVPDDDHGWHVSLSHATGQVAVAVAPVPCGVDVERLREARVGNVARRYFAPAEAEWLEQLEGAARLEGFFRLWTLKEAAVKALGAGLAGNLARLSFTLDGNAPRLRSAGPALQLYQTTEPPLVLAAAADAARPVQWTLQRLHDTDL